VWQLLGFHSANAHLLTLARVSASAAASCDPDGGAAHIADSKPCHIAAAPAQKKKPPFLQRAASA